MNKYQPSELARIYDGKIMDETNINNLLAVNDKKVFNHNGILLPGYKKPTPKSESELLKVLHQMEADQVSFCLQVIDAIPSNQLLLDAGCGAGGTSLILHETFSCCIEGFTLSPKQAEYANAVAEYYGCSEQVQFFVGDILNLPRSANHFDVVWACENTEHLPNLNSMYQEFSRVTRAGGRLIIVAWCATTSPMGHSIKGQVDDHYKTDIHTRAEYLSAAQTNGWSLRRQVEMTSLTAPYWELRSFSKHRTGSESFMWEGFSTGTEEYHLFEFERD